MKYYFYLYSNEYEVNLVKLLDSFCNQIEYYANND